MNIALIGSGYDVFYTLGLFCDIQQHFFCIIDKKYGPREQKSWELTYERVQASIDYALLLGAEKIILPPVFELLFQDSSQVIPIYKSYLLNYVFPGSRVGKLGILGEIKASKKIQSLLQSFSKHYSLTDFQAKTKKFQSPFSRWTKDISLRSSFLARAKPSDRMVRKYIKNDLRYFQDADVDTLIPTSYTHFYWDTILRHHLNFKKIRRHEKKHIQSLATKLLGTGESYACKMFANDDIQAIVKQYPWKGFIQKGTKNAVTPNYSDW